MWLIVFFILIVNNIDLVAQTEKGIGDAQPNTQLNLIEAKGKINFALPNLNFSAQFEAKIVGEDSAVLSIFGPMGVLLAKAFSNNEYFIYYDVFNNWAVVGTPTREKIFEASRVPLNFTDFVRLFKGKFIYPPDLMKNTKLNEDKILYSRKNGDFYDFFLIDKDSKLIQYQKKNSDDKIVLNVSYTDYFSNDTLLFPKKYVLQIEERKGSVSLETEKINFNVDTSRPFSFSIPKNVEIFEFR